MGVFVVVVALVGFGSSLGVKMLGLVEFSSFFGTVFELTGRFVLFFPGQTLHIESLNVVFIVLALPLARC